MSKKIWAIILSLCISLTMVACGGDGGGEKIDTDKTQLYVNVYDCGIGREFAENLKAEYEKQHSDIQIILSSTDLDSDGLRIMGSDTSIDVAFAPNFIINDFVNVKNGTCDYFADITDILTEGGANSIASKMYKDEKAYHNVGTVESPRYFSLPWYVSYFGTIYDVDLFEEYHFYNLDGYAGLDCIPDTEDDCWGPDGKEGTYDDGLPATWEDMKTLFDVMAEFEILPFTWTSYEGYVPAWLEALWGSYEGSNNYSLLSTFEGKYVSSVNKSGYVSRDDGNFELAVSLSNGYEMAYQNGKIAALTVAKYIVDNQLYSQKARNSSQKHTMAQDEYLQSVVMQEYGQKRIAFLLEGNWWENEAKPVFKDVAAIYGNQYAFGQRKFAYFPFPKFIGSSDIPDQVNTATVLHGSVLSSQTNVCVVNKSSKNLAIAKDFVKFAYSDVSNAAFTTDTGVLRPFDYELSDSQKAKLTYYQRSVYDLARESDTEKISGLTRSGLIFDDRDYVEGIGAFLGKNDKNTTFGKNSFEEFALDAGLTVNGYLDGVKRFVDSKKSIWGN